MQTGSQGLFDGAFGEVLAYLPTLLAGIGILIIGWILSALLGRLVRTGLRRSGIDARAEQWLQRDGGEGAVDVADVGGRITFGVAMLFVLVAFFQTLRLTLVTEPLNALLAELASFAPRVLGAAVLLGVAWLVAVVLRRLVRAVIERSGLESRLSAPEEASGRLPATIGDAVYWVTLFLFLPAILGALAIDGLLGPVQSVADQVLGFLPNVIAAIIILGIGWFAAKLIREVVRNLTAAVGLDRLGERVGISGSNGSTLSELAALIVYLLVLVPVVIGALNALDMAAVTGPASAMLERILTAIPAVFAAGLLLVFAFVVGRLIADMARSLMDGLGLDAWLERIGLFRPVEGRPGPAQVVGKVILAAVLLFASMEAAAVLGFAALATLLQAVVVFAGQVFLALLILGVGFYLSGLAQDAIRTSTSSAAPTLALIARVGILLLVGAMALEQVSVGGRVTSIAFGSIIGAIAIAMAIAFGIGGRDVARGYLERWTRSLGGPPASGAGR